MKTKIFLTGIALLLTVFIQAQTQSAYNEKIGKKNWEQTNTE